MEWRSPGNMVAEVQSMRLSGMRAFGIAISGFASKSRSACGRRCE